MGLLTIVRGGTLAPSMLHRLTPSFVDVQAFDAFTDANGTLLENHVASDGGTWTKHGLSAVSSTIDSGRVHNTTSGIGLYYHSWLPASADYDVEGDVVVITDNNSAIMGVAGRIDTAANTLYCLAYVTASNEWVVFNLVAGVLTLLGGSVVQVLTPGQVYRARLSLRGSQIAGFVDGVQIISAGDTAITAPGRAGVRPTGFATATTGVQLDSWRVRQ